MRAPVLFLMLAPLFFMSAAAQAKDVFIEWTPLQAAIRYELEIAKGNQMVLRKQIEDTKWSGELALGYYAYRVRAYDKLNRPGVWGEVKALVVMPGPPAIESPRGGDEIGQFNPNAGFQLRWKPIEGVSRYHVVVKQGGGVIMNRVVTGTQLDVRHAGQGQFSWRVSSVVEGIVRTPASNRERVGAAKYWESEPQIVERFTVIHDQLERPVAKFPVGNVMPQDGGVVRFRWEEVEGAEAYQIKVYPTPERGPASERVPVKAFVVKATEMDVKFARDGDYTWEVRALANVDANRVAGAVGPVSVTRFKLDEHGEFEEKSGYIALSTMMAPYSYKITSNVTRVEGTFDSKLITGRLSGEYWLGAKIALAAGFEHTKMTVLNQSVTRTGFELNAKYRMPLGSGWTLMPKLGLEMRQYPEVRPLDAERQAFTLFNPQAAGAMLGFDLRKTFSPSFSMGLRAGYFMPLTMSGVEGTMGGGSATNLSFGAQGLYWVGKKWGVGAGGFLDLRSFSYTATSANGGSAVQTIEMNGTFFFGSLIYSFGK